MFWHHRDTVLKTKWINISLIRQSNLLEHLVSTWNCCERQEGTLSYVRSNNVYKLTTIFVYVHAFMIFLHVHVVPFKNAIQWNKFESIPYFSKSVDKSAPVRANQISSVCFSQNQCQLVHYIDCIKIRVLTVECTESH